MSRRDVAVRAACMLGVDRVLDRAARRHGGVILAWHRVTADMFERQATVVAGRYEIVPLMELVTRHESGTSTSGMAAFTFDDAYRDTMIAVAEVADRRGWHVTSFVPTNAVATGSLHWFSRIRVVAGVAALDANTHLDVEELVRSTEAECFYRPLAECNAVVEAFRDRLQPQLSWEDLDAHPLAAQYQTLSWHQVRELDTAGTIAFGPHTVHHPFLATLDHGEVIAELDGSMEALAAHVGEVVPVICYPYGDARSIGVDAPKLARASARVRMHAGVTMVRGRVSQASDAMLLPRVPIYDADDAATVAIKVATAR